MPPPIVLTACYVLKDPSLQHDSFIHLHTLMISKKKQLKGSVITILDQAIVSITNFATALILARFLGIHEFGIYSLFFIAIILLSTVHYSIFTAPMMTLTQGIDNTTRRQEYLSSVKTAQTLFAALIALTYYVAIKVFSESNFLALLHSNLIPFTLCMAIIPLQEWYRRYLFANSLTLSAFYLDIVKSTVQLSLLVYYTLTGGLHINIALYILATASAITYLASSIQNRLEFRLKDILSTIQSHWHHSQHLLPSYLLEWVRLQGFLVFGGVLLGAEAVGAIRAAQNIVGPLNIIYQAADNILPVEGAKRLAKEGKKSMIQYFKDMEIKGILLLAVPCFFVSLLSEEIISFLYGQEFGEYSTLVIWQAISLLLAYSMKVGSSLLRTINATKPILSSSVTSTVALVILMMPLSTLFSIDGIMLAKIAAEMISIILMSYLIRENLKSTIQTS